MAQALWQLQTAKAQFSELVEAALRGEPQRITRRGKDAVMLVSEASFLALKQSAKRAPVDLVEHLLAMPREKTLKVPRRSDSGTNGGAAASQRRKLSKTPSLRLRNPEL